MRLCSAASLRFLRALRIPEMAYADRFEPVSVDWKRVGHSGSDEETGA
jgi:hypothetical protein